MRVFVFRPRPDAERTARAIAEHGFEPVVAPLFEVIRLTDAAPEGAFDALVLTSGNGVPALVDGPATWRDLPVFTVGSRTAAKVREAAAEPGMPVTVPRTADLPMKSTEPLIRAAAAMVRLSLPGVIPLNRNSWVTSGNSTS